MTYLDVGNSEPGQALFLKSASEKIAEIVCSLKIAYANKLNNPELRFRYVCYMLLDVTCAHHLLFPRVCLLPHDSNGGWETL